MEEKKGVWRTVGGRRIFIADGEDLESAMKKSGKFGTKQTTREEYPLDNSHKEWIEDYLEDALKEAKDLNKAMEIKENALNSVFKAGHLSNDMRDQASEYVDSIFETFIRREHKKRHEAYLRSKAQ